MAPRAVRNNNPGNIRVGTAWQGLMPRGQMTGDQLQEKDFCVFQTPVWGFRAMSEIFLTYHAKHGVQTLRQAISRWAPPNENNTDAYVVAVSHYCGFDPDATFPFSDPGAQQHLCYAVSVHECGAWYFSTGDLVHGVGAATSH